jgi:sugar phosphate isomerase/epimerase
MSLRPMEIGVFVSGSNPLASIRKVKSLGLNNCQMGVPGAEWRTPERIAQIRKALADEGVSITCIFNGYPGESYADIPTIRATIGFVPSDLRAARVAMTLENADFAKALDVSVVAAHIGFVPEETSDERYTGIVAALRTVCDHCAKNNQKFALETGQETAEILLRLIKDVGRDNLGVNFDPANMLLYGSGDPIDALGKVGKYVIGAHMKDGAMPETDGVLGTEYPLGQGKVGFPRFIGLLKELGYTGPLTIEREIEGEQQTRDILVAIKFLEGVRG